MDNTLAGPKLMPLHLLEEITCGFSQHRKLGGGAYGNVYLGEHNDGEKIAVKVLNEVLHLDDEQFDKEYHNIASLQHKNVVRLTGYCNETKREYVQYNGRIVLAEKTKRVLCFEYMHNGSLDNFISDESNTHNWRTCYTIIKGICEGLEYLHEKLESPMYHLDLKPDNVLLDENMSPKIADFGLSRLFGEDKTKITKSAIGTHGYVPPEYIEAGVISIKFDIYSLGVMIIKIMTGRDGYFRSADMSSQQFIELVHTDWMNRLQATSVYMHSIQVRRCIEIALSCIEADPHKRPSIWVIVNNLNETESTNKILDELRKGLGSPIDQKIPLFTWSRLPFINGWLRSNTALASHKVCPCISNETEMLDILKNKLISYPLHVTDNRGRVHEATITTVGDSAGGTSTFQLVRPRIKIIDCKEGFNNVVSIDVHSKEPWILVAHRDGVVSIWNHKNQVWNIHSPAPVATLDHKYPGSLDYFRPNGDRQYLVTGSSFGNAQIWDLQKSTVIKQIDGLQRWQPNIAVVEGLPGRQILLTVSEDRTVAFCDSLTHRYENRVNFNLGNVRDIAYIKATKSLAIGCREGIAIMEIN